MTTMTQISAMPSVLGAPRQSDGQCPSTVWSIGTVATAPKTLTHAVKPAFGANATYHPRPEEAPL
jgi:hypothetical protein